mmetsp:Transcript_38660/g.56920  ORF Transcript_38660/g.56920 Transcript_38660/m.56920 type:complete len:223 (-) Transcript_38660:1485-2153(-)
MASVSVESRIICKVFESVVDCALIVCLGLGMGLGGGDPIAFCKSASRERMRVSCSFSFRSNADTCFWRLLYCSSSSPLSLRSRSKLDSIFRRRLTSMVSRSLWLSPGVVRSGSFPSSSASSLSSAPSPSLYSSRLRTRSSRFIFSISIWEGISSICFSRFSTIVARESRSCVNSCISAVCVFRSFCTDFSMDFSSSRRVVLVLTSSLTSASNALRSAIRSPN